MLARSALIDLNCCLGGYLRLRRPRGEAERQGCTRSQ